MERTKYIQGRSGTKSKDCLPFVQYYKCLEKKKENENIQYFHLCFSFPSPCPTGNLLPLFHTYSPLPPKTPKFLFTQWRVLPKTLPAELLPLLLQFPNYIFFFHSLQCPVPSSPSWGWEESGITFKNKKWPGDENVVEGLLWCSSSQVPGTLLSCYSIFSTLSTLLLSVEVFCLTK